MSYSRNMVNAATFIPVIKEDLPQIPRPTMVGLHHDCNVFLDSN